MTFWDFCAPFYDIAQKTNGNTYTKMIEKVREHVPQNATVLEVAAGTGAISIAVADKVKSIYCTDISERMLLIARRKANKRRISNISFANLDALDIDIQDNCFDVIIAGQVLHLLNDPIKAASELRRVAKDTVILPMSFIKNLYGMAKFKMTFFRLLGFNPRYEFDGHSYAEFLQEIGFENCTIIEIPGNIPMAVAIWKGGEKMQQAMKSINPDCKCNNCKCNPCICKPVEPYPCGCD